MDYLNIVLKGYFNLNNREYMSKYFFREFKKAEEENARKLAEHEYFRGNLKVV